MPRSSPVVPAALLLCLAIPAQAQMANFDSLPEGPAGTVVTDGGITFSNLDRRSGDPFPAPFSIDSVEEGRLDPAFYSPPNVLGFGEFSEGPGVTFSPFGSFEMTTGVLSSSASLELHEFGSTPRNVILLEALLNGQSVGGVTVNIPREFGSLNHFTLTLSNVTFDRLRVSAGPNDNSVIRAVIDNVRIGAVPPPCRVDVTGDGQVNVQDFLSFLQLFAAGADGADFNRDRDVNIQDFLAFLAAYAAGC
jgi:hypothetical protein